LWYLDLDWLNGAAVSELRIKINQDTKTAVFSGPGTFAAKEQIKQLGFAHWNPADKSWEVSQVASSVDEIRQKFPNSVVEEEGNRELSADAVKSSEDAFDAAQDKAAPKTNDGFTLPPSFSVGELVAKVKEVLRHAFPGTVYVRGVISKVTTGKDGRIFLDLAEAEQTEESISCAIWREAEKVCKPLFDAGFRLEPDLQVMFAVRVDVNPRRSNLMLTVVGVVAEYTIAKLAAQRDLTNERLKKEGLFERNKKLSLAFLPRRLGLLTSAGGTVINDFRASLDVSKFGFELYWVDTSVQGAAAKGDIIRGLEILTAMKNLDAVLIFRGGGSAGDLAVFNDYDVAKAICLCTVPVISAIGHEQDQSSVQDVSFLALGVPKEIGWYFANIVIERRRTMSEAVNRIQSEVGQQLTVISGRLSDCSRNLHGLAFHVLTRASETLSRLRAALPAQGIGCLSSALQRLTAFTSPVAALAQQSGVYQASRFLHLVETLFLNGARLVEREEKRTEVFEQICRAAAQFADIQEKNIETHETLINSAGPETQLKRGFSLIRRAEDQTFVTAGKQIKRDDLVDIEFHDVSHRARIS
jgi:exodeoxyribonuclease VII large subunit